MAKHEDFIHSRTWQEEAEPDNPFAAKICHCAGYDVYGELLNKATYFEYLYLLFKGERPEPWQTNLLEGIAMVLANPGPRDHGVRAAMNGGVGGSHSAGSLMAAMGVGAGQLGGGRDIYNAMTYWQQCGTDLEAWLSLLSDLPQPECIDAWLPMEHAAGFDPHGRRCALPVKQALNNLQQRSEGKGLAWLESKHLALEAVTEMPLAMTGVVAAAFYELGLDADQGEMLSLILRLPGAAMHALEQRGYGWKKYPFWFDGIELVNDPGPYTEPKKQTEDAL